MDLLIQTIRLFSGTIGFIKDLYEITYCILKFVSLALP